LSTASKVGKTSSEKKEREAADGQHNTLIIAEPKGKPSSSLTQQPNNMELEGLASGSWTRSKGTREGSKVSP
jgi:hypothetical protein